MNDFVQYNFHEVNIFYVIYHRAKALRIRDKMLHGIKLSFSQ
jgi:hypothetical protein